jgi:hypothetical protein
MLYSRLRDLCDQAQICANTSFFVPVTCDICNKQFFSIGALCDHISDTGKGIQGSPRVAADARKLISDKREKAKFVEATRGLAHLQYHDYKGQYLDKDELINLFVMVTVGKHLCGDCKEQFPNHYRLCEHYLISGHGGPLASPAREDMNWFDALEQKWF